MLIGNEVVQRDNQGELRPFRRDHVEREALQPMSMKNGGSDTSPPAAQSNPCRNLYTQRLTRW